MRRILLLAIVAVAFSACGGCNDDTTQNNAQNANNDPIACADLDEDGFDAGDDCEENAVLDCNDSDASANPDAEEACGDGVDNDCDGQTDEGCIIDGPCTDGAMRECGTDVGACSIGVQICENSAWSDCDGQGPITETCNGEDDDCDGETDENGIELCDDGMICNGVSMCEDGACTEPQELDCSDLSGPCSEGRCSEKDRGCRAFPLDNGTACDDGLFCTENGACNAGECVTTARDCSSEEDACNIGVCDEAAGSCVKQPKSDGTLCDDGLYCTIMDTCTAGVCGGADRDCSSAADQCNTGTCDDTADACVPSPILNGTMCDDGQYCTVNDVCTNGACTAGTPRQCGAAGGSCRDGVCDEATDSCTGDPVPDGTSCDDGRFCTENDICSAGTCTGGGPRDCSGVSATCRVGMCNELLNQCIATASPDGTTCDDGMFCTVNDTCTNGACGGGMRNCASAGGECQTGVCDEASDACVGQPASDGSACPDSLFCTQNEVCLSGSCTRAPRDCSSVGDVCNDGLCDDNADACIAVAKTDGTACTDGLFCTSNDSCQAGVCTGGPTSCSQLDDGCTVGVCDEDMNACSGQAAPDNTPCDDDQFCTTMDSCSGGVCTGAQRNCAVMSDDCNVGVCDDTADACVPDPTLLEGTSCDDGDFCTVMDVCASGACGGSPRDCSAVEDDCNDSMCTQGGCQPVPLTGNTCTLGAFCIVNTTCDAGVCVGEDRDCTPAMPDMCLDYSCNENTDMCMSTDNGSCDTCDTSRPTASAGPDHDAVPNETVLLNGTGSSDPTGQTLTYQWRIESAPVGSTAQLSNTTAVSPFILADVSGTFVICLEVIDTDGCVSSEDCAQIEVAPLVDLHIELVWFADDSDFDLHYQAPDYAESRWFTPQVAVWYGATNPNWGGGASGDQPDGDNTNDPSLDVDNRDGFGPENINQSNLFDGDPFTVGVHYFSNTDTTLEPFTGPTDARVRIYENGALVYEETRNLKCQEFWEVAEIEITGGGTSINVTNKNAPLRREDPLSSPACRCNTDSDCTAGETCQPFRIQGGGPPRFADLCAP